MADETKEEGPALSVASIQGGIIKSAQRLTELTHEAKYYQMLADTAASQVEGVKSALAFIDRYGTEEPNDRKMLKDEGLAWCVRLADATSRLRLVTESASLNRTEYRFLKGMLASKTRSDAEAKADKAE